LSALASVENPARAHVDAEVPADMFSVDIEVANGTSTVRLSGELDAGTAPQLRSAVTASLADGASSVVFDCSELSFIDSMGLNALIEARDAAAEQRGTATVTGASGTVLRVLRLTGLAEQFGLSSSDSDTTD
jgi:anti-anti-sigma factor